MNLLIEHEGVARLSVFLCLFFMMALFETLWPKRQRTIKRHQRWVGNLGVMFLGALLARVILPWAPVSVAIYAQINNIGLMEYAITDPLYNILLGVLLLDLFIYLQHIVMHKVPFLWRLHRLHHADLEYDVTTGIRFHPLEIILSLLLKMGIILLFGVEPLSVIIFEMLLNGSAMFNHANLRLPLWLDKGLRLLVVTPDMHRVHHSSIRNETDSNYGFFLSIWDKIFATYRAQPQKGHLGMEIGLEYFRDERELNLLRLLTQPFRQAK